MALPLALGALVLAAGCGPGDKAPIVFDSLPPDTTSPAAIDTLISSPLGPDTTAVPTTDPVQLGPWIDVTGNLAGMQSECGNMSFVGANPGNDQVIAGVAQQGLWASDAATGQWSRLGGGITNRTATLIFDPAAKGRFWESGSYSGPGAFATANAGQAFQALGSITHLDGLSVDLTDPNRRTMLAGSHERSDLFHSTDGGASWTNLASHLPPGIGYASQPLVLDSQHYLLGTYNAPGSAILSSTDGGVTWKQVFAGGVAGPPLVASDGSIYWPLESGRGLVHSTDGGATWILVTGRGVLASYNVVQLADGRLASVSKTHLVVSDDGGTTWRGLGPALPSNGAYGLAYSQARNSIYIWQWDCGTKVPAGAVQRLDLTPSAG